MRHETDVRQQLRSLQNQLNRPLTRDNLDHSDIAQKIRGLKKQYWKEYRFLIDDESFPIKALAQDSNFGENETDGDCLLSIMRKKPQAAAEILRRYGLTLTRDEWQTLEDLSGYRREDAHALEWLQINYRKLKKIFDQVQDFVTNHNGTSEVGMVSLDDTKGDITELGLLSGEIKGERQRGLGNQEELMRLAERVQAGLPMRRRDFAKAEELVSKITTDLQQLIKANLVKANVGSSSN